jgi:hypothetical protein
MHIQFASLTFLNLVGNSITSGEVIALLNMPVIEQLILSKFVMM